MQAGGKAVGLSGVDSGLLRAKKIDKDGVDLGFVGDVTEVHPEILETLLDKGYIPVVSTVALGEQGDMSRYNINADTAAAKIAVALNREPCSLPTSPVCSGCERSSSSRRLDHVAVPSMIATGVISEGMIPKIECNLEAIKGGVPRTYIIDGRVPHALLIEMFSDRGIGTMIV